MFYSYNALCFFLFKLQYFFIARRRLDIDDLSLTSQLVSSNNLVYFYSDLFLDGKFCLDNNFGFVTCHFINKIFITLYQMKINYLPACQ